MLESTESLLPFLINEHNPPVICAGYSEDSLDELSQLLTTLELKPVEIVNMASRKIRPATYIGKGKIDEIREIAQSHQAKALIVDVELSPKQLANLEKEAKIPVLDRPGVILEIFSRHARSKEAKTQVALARLQYLLPRLAHFWNHFERQRGGGATSRGMGEKQLEVDRRLVKKRIALLRDRLQTIEKERVVQRSSRSELLKVALVGYTNAGKSTLLNRLTQSDVRAEDKLFATLDSSARALDPHSHPPIVAIDTVGFISNLPHALVASFRSTLEELQNAQLLLHVVDGSHPNAADQIQVTEGVLRELGLEEKPRMTVLNKMDRVETLAQKNQIRILAPGASMISAFDDQAVIQLREQILEHFRKGMEVWEILLPYDQSKLEAMMRVHATIENYRHLSQGTFFRVRIENHWAKKLGLEKFRT